MSTLIDRYFRTRGPASLDEISAKLWTGDATESWTTRDDKYHAALLDQYKIYAEMADRISARRGLANAFFLTLNTTIASAIGALWQQPSRTSAWLAVAPLIALLGQCLAWFWILRSYRQLNSAKYAVVGALERRLPASPYWEAEWTALGHGKDPAQYWPLTSVEQWVPFLFGLLYIVGFAALLLA